MSGDSDEARSAGAAQSCSIGANTRPADCAETDADLSAIIESWDRLTPAVRRSLAAIAQASVGG